MVDLTISVRYSPRPASARCDLPGVSHDTIPWTGALTVDGQKVGTLRGSSVSYVLDILTKSASQYHA